MDICRKNRRGRVPSEATSTGCPHRLRFSLKGLLVAVTLLAIGLSWLGWWVNTVRERAVVRQLISERGGAIVRPTKYYSIKDKHSLEFANIAFRNGHVHWATASSDLSFVRRWLGDESVSIILLNNGGGLARVRAAFPEARIAIRQTLRDER